MAAKVIDIAAGDALAVAAGLDDAASLCTHEQAALAARLRVGAATIRTQQRRIEAAQQASGAIKHQLRRLMEAI